MAAGPTLHIFPPVEEAAKRRESLDDLIRRSMDMRPSGPWPVRRDSASLVTKAKASSGDASRPSSDHTRVGVAITRDPSPSPAQQRVKYLPPIEEAKSSPRENPFQKLPPIQVPKREPSATRGTRPRRSSSVGARNRNIAVSPAVRRTPSPGPSVARHHGSPGSNKELSVSTAPILASERTSPSRSLNRSRVCVPKRAEDGGEVAAITSPINPCNYYFMPPQRQASVRSAQSSHSAQSSSTLQSNLTLQRNASRSTVRSRFPIGSDQRRQSEVQTPLTEYDGISPSSTLGRNSFMGNKQWTQIAAPPTSDLPIRSMFPILDPNVPLAQQAYRPQGIVPTAVISPEKISRTPYSPNFNSALLLPEKRDPVYITPISDLNSLWATANGKLDAPDPKHFTLKMFKPMQEDRSGKEKIVFGPAEDQPFYTLSKTHTKTEDGDDHELFVQRHHTSGEDILPVSHLDLTPPPPPTLSKINRGSVTSDVDSPAQHVTTIMPILASLHALEGAAKTPQAKSIAEVDPNATSPAAQRLAERAVAEASQREGCTLAWSAIDALNGKYELHHPSLGVFNISVVGDVKSAFELGVVKGQTCISILNPYSCMASLTGSPVSSSSRTSAMTAVEREPEILARLDFQDGCLHIDAAAIQQLGNLYLIDVCVSTLLSVAVSEGKRPEDPGLVFAAPPPSLLSFKATSKKVKTPKIKEITEVKPAPKPAKKARKPRPVTIMANSLGLGFEHIVEKEDLPRITKAILSLLGISFKGAVYLMGFGVKVMAMLVIWLTKKTMTDKD
ncbi:uncharacterized protein PV09_01304 [Verruconis gallopava]|uniref:Uncharacterized protein n=1 Tax=Verruconis gallopava TaxID=253628 RepID=A0A0D1Z606_9PEZI|nr:uncharacterized protein PV09_01304 [Verruconis gallopava]KIW08392.1 hypothetical protein PV09_01304 [Verruconis gallopava]